MGGKVSLEVLQVCEAGAAQLLNAKRREELLHILGDAAPCNEPSELLHTLEQSLHKLFSSSLVALHLVIGRELPQELQCTALVSAAGVVPGSQKARKASRQSRISKLQFDGLRGIVGQAVKACSTISYSPSEKDSEYSSSVDLPVKE